MVAFWIIAGAVLGGVIVFAIVNAAAKGAIGRGLGW